MNEFVAADSKHSVSKLQRMVSSPGRRPPRRRRSPEESRAEILRTAHRFLTARPFRELTVELLMDESVLSRSSFYVYFKDRHELVRALIADIVDEILEFSKGWVGGEDEKTDIRALLSRVESLYENHGGVLRALADGAAGDEELEQIHQELTRTLVAATEAGINRAVSRGASVVEDPAGVAQALVVMTERVANASWAGRDDSGRDEGVAAALSHIWSWSIYGEPPSD